MPATISKYGAAWPAHFTPLQIEFGAIQHGGQWSDKNGKLCGNGLFYHYKESQKLLWPGEDHHRWSDLLLQEFVSNTITCVLGPKDSGKTRGASKFALTDWFCFPNETLILVSSTDIRGLELRVWGDLKHLWQMAVDLHDWLPGTVLESKHAIATDSLEDGEARDLRKGIICIPCIGSGNQWLGLGKYVGIKQKRRRLVSDECQLMKAAFLDSIANLNSGDFKGVFLGNPLGQDDPLDKVSEPKAGWESHPIPEKTVVWENKWIGGRTINLVGTDSPNFDFPKEQPPKFSYLVNWNSMANVEAFYGKDSHTYCSQCEGIRRSGLNARRVITKELCEQFHAFEGAKWMAGERIKVGASDIAFGGVGGDRCIVGWGEFGPGIDGQTILLVHEPTIVPVTAKNTAVRVEDQIANFERDYCKANDVPPENFGYDSTGRGTMGTSFAQAWSANVLPIEFGGVPTARPVSLDLFIIDPDTGERRLKLCYEEYSKFVTELWFTVRYLIMGDQLRGLTQEVAKEGYAREWKTVKGNKTEIESKVEMKERTGRSPDLFDWLVTLVEVARRRGLPIKKLAKVQVEKEGEENWYEIERRKMKEAIRRSTLTHN